MSCAKENVITLEKLIDKNASNLKKKNPKSHEKHLLMGFEHNTDFAFVNHERYF